MVVILGIYLRASTGHDKLPKSLIPCNKGEAISLAGKVNRRVSYV